MRYAVYLVTAWLLLAACKKQFNDYYDRPGSLEPPVYQQLEARGNFKHLLAAIDKAGYKEILSAAGYWTFFAPHDSAFQLYLTSKNLSSVEELDAESCRQIVTYSLVYNAFRKERLDDYQGATGWVPSAAFKRRTANYTFVYNGTDTSGKAIKVIASNRNGVSYSDIDNNNKYLPYFTDAFMASNNLTAADYNYFYPKTPYTGFNVADAIVTEQDIPAENGIIHVVNKVITVLPSIDQYLRGKPEYSLFKTLFDKFLVQYVLNQAVTRRYRATTGSTDNVYTKIYSAPFGSLAFSLNNENHLIPGNDAQKEGYTIFAPENEVLEKYIREVLLEHYPPGTSLNDVPVSIVYDFINAHLWQKAVWPSKFNATTNYLGEEARFDPATNITDRQLLSNGIFYGTNKVQESNVFTSVYGRAYLDPAYSMMTKLLNFEMKSVVADIGRDFTVFMISDTMLRAAGYTNEPAASNNIYEQYRFTPPPGSTIPAAIGATARNRLLRILNMHIVPAKVLNDFSGEGMAMTLGGEFIGFKNNTLFASGNVEAAETVTVGSSKTARNGRVYYINKPLLFSESMAGAPLEKLAATPTPSTSPYNYFFEFLKSSSIWNSATKEITGIANGSFYTLFVPTNAAIRQAVRDRMLPGDAVTGAPNFNAATQTNFDKELVVRFIHHHFLDRRTVAADGEESGSMPTVLRTNLGDPTTVFVNNLPGHLQLKDMNDRTATVISSASTYLGNRIVIHLIDNYLKYTF
ncbi:fasciclin domain-containing protein [Longitalea arenae]|uniref:fasciclin domain-containing protein n=1 Tax=Longitalea arenae TaxID=2812558 RepID=UPI00196876AE|nr:fasciclin domain-containing protein [Longitalea arenae]